MTTAEADAMNINKGVDDNFLQREATAQPSPPSLPCAGGGGRSTSHQTGSPSRPAPEPHLRRTALPQMRKKATRRARPVVTPSLTVLSLTLFFPVRPDNSQHTTRRDSRRE